MSETSGETILVTSNYWPEKHGISVFTQDLIKTLRGIGANPVVLTGLPYFPLGEFTLNNSTPLSSESGPFGERLFRYKHWVPKNSSAYSRILFEFVTMVKGLIRSIQLPKQEYARVVVYVPIISAAVVGLFLAKRHKIKAYIFIQDISFLALSQTSMPGSKYFTQIAKRLEGAIFSRFDHIATISVFMRNVLQSNLSLSNVAVIPNYTVIKTQKCVESQRESRMKLGLNESDFFVIFTGSIGYKTKLEVFINSAKETKNAMIKYLIFGSGPRLKYFQDLASGLDNVIFFSSVQEGHYPFLLASADVFFLGEYATQLGMSLPSKLFGYVNQEKPVIAAVPHLGPTADFISDKSLLFNPDDAHAIAVEIQNLHEDRDYYTLRAYQSKSISQRNNSDEPGASKVISWITCNQN